ncbi:lytic transglycosylase domain-containing protein [Acidipila sp. EB88]|uniref:lytic transglycosylase domain-containing protein n=1 Tax=Acidipila sp. EB88 TaxID=2305226 RepID=UPI000F5E2627|nr:lytic transglycosylase domain-containing protein [Acidipila sp. EB88]RRA48817.1 lytic transglycosylase domain-containing protein [Acidipila sp. EB88]
MLSLFHAPYRVALLATALPALIAPAALAAEHITLRNGYDLVCDHRVVEGERTRLYLDQVAADYVEVRTDDIVAAEAFTPMVPAQAASTTPLVVAAQQAGGTPPKTPENLTGAELHEVLAGAGAAHDLDVDLLASVVHAESNGRVHARSHAGAEGLMQLMPGTAAALGVHDSFAPAENVGGGAAYLGSLLQRYHENLAYALAAYNAGPGAVDRWHGVPPYRETRAYVARIIHEFNQRYAARQAMTLAAAVRVTKP